MSASASLPLLIVSTAGAGDGAERFAASALQHLDRARFRPSLALLGRGQSFATPPDVALQRLSDGGRARLPAGALRLHALLRREQPRVVVSVCAPASLVCGAALLLARRRPRWIARVSADPEGPEAGPLRPCLHRLYRRADRLVANSRELCARVERVCGRRTRLLRNFTDFAALDRAAREPVPPPAPGRRRIVALGRLEPVKRFDLLLEALARLRGRFELELVICGEGTLRGRLEARARALGLGQGLRLPGFVANPFAWLASAELFVLSSDSEGLPNALVEAQGLGVAAVASDCGSGPREVVDDGETGLLVPPGDAQALASAIAALLGDDARRLAMAAAARERTRARYDAAVGAARLESLLEEVAAAPPLDAAGRSQIS